MRREILHVNLKFLLQAAQQPQKSSTKGFIIKAWALKKATVISNINLSADNTIYFLNK